MRRQHMTGYRADAHNSTLGAAAAPGELAVDVALARSVRAQLRQPRVVLLLHAWRPACMAEATAALQQVWRSCTLLLAGSGSNHAETPCTRRDSSFHTWTGSLPGRTVQDEGGSKITHMK